MLHVLLVTANLIELVTVVALDDGSLWVLREVNFEELEHELIFIRLSMIVCFMGYEYDSYDMNHIIKPLQNEMITVPKFFVSIFPFS